ncbi:MAG: hypothetical protein J6Y87_02065 [Muribaculaceae bacterium]|nr:hypothetical protein [Muribaculaceae bacterium]
MKKILLLYATFFLVVTGCKNGSYDSRLITVDSLLWQKDKVADYSDLERAASLLAAVDKSTLSADDKAYYSLLSVESKYKNFQPILDEDTIDADEAVAVFGRSSDSSKKLRSYIIRGAVEEELGRPLVAAEWYEKALEITGVPPSLRAYSHFRMAVLLDINQLSELSRRIDHYRVAADGYAAVGDSVKLARCYFDLAHVYGEEIADSTEYFLTRCLEVAQANSDSVMIAEALCGFSTWYVNNNNPVAALEYAEKAVKIGGDLLPDGTPMLCLANAEITAGNAATGRKTFETVDSATARPDLWLITRQRLAEVEDNYQLAFQLLSKRYEIADSVATGDVQRNLLRTDLKQSLMKSEVERAELRSQRVLWTALAGLFAVAVAVLALYLRSRSREHRAMSMMVDQLRHDKYLLVDEKNALLGANSYLKTENEQLQSEQGKLLGDVERHLSSFMALAENVTNVKGFDKMVENLRATLNNVADDEFYRSVVALANKKTGGVIDRLSQKSDLSQRELTLVALSAVGCSAFMISILLDYKNYRYVYTVRNNIARRLGYPTLEAFFTSWSKEED